MLSPAVCLSVGTAFAERLSARQLILRRISEIVCMYARLGIQLFRALRANVVSRAPV